MEIESIDIQPFNQIKLTFQVGNNNAFSSKSFYNENRFKNFSN